MAASGNVKLCSYVTERMIRWLVRIGNLCFPFEMNIPVHLAVEMPEHYRFIVVYMAVSGNIRGSEITMMSLVWQMLILLIAESLHVFPWL